MLVNADRGTVDHLEVALVSGRNCFVNSVPDAQFPPPHEAVVAGRRRTIALGYVGPGRSRAQAPENPVQHLAIIHPWLAARLVRQQRLNDRPFKISDLVAASTHHISSFEELETHHPEPRYQFMSLRPSLAACPLSCSTAEAAKEFFYLNYIAAQLACEAVDNVPGRGRRRFVLGLIRDNGRPTAAREMKKTITSQVEALISGGVDGVALKVSPNSGRASIFLSAACEARRRLQAREHIYFQRSLGIPR